jgi:hypothetical protein
LVTIQFTSVLSFATTQNSVRAKVKAEVQDDIIIFVVQAQTWALG